MIEKGKTMKENLENIVKRLNGMQIVYSLGEYDINSYIEALKEIQEELNEMLSRQYSVETRDVLEEVETKIELLNKENSKKTSQRRMF